MTPAETKLLCYVAIVVVRMYSYQITKMKMLGEDEKPHLVKLVECLSEVNETCGKIAKKWAIEQSAVGQLYRFRQTLKRGL